VINRDAVKQKGGNMREFWNVMKSALTLGFLNFRGVFEYGKGRDWFIGGDLQVAAEQLIEDLGWTEEYRQLKLEGDAREHQIRQEVHRSHHNVEVGRDAREYQFSGLSYIFRHCNPNLMIRTCSADGTFRGVSGRSNLHIRHLASTSANLLFDSVQQWPTCNSIV
jgi:hypothetical protein